MPLAWKGGTQAVAFEEQASRSRGPYVTNCSCCIDHASGGISTRSCSCTPCRIRGSCTCMACRRRWCSRERRHLAPLDVMVVVTCEWFVAVIRVGGWRGLPSLARSTPWWHVRPGREEGG